MKYQYIDRPGIQKLFKLAEQKIIDTVLILDGGRLSRDLSQILQVEKKLKEFGVKLVSPTGDPLSEIQQMSRELGLSGADEYCLLLSRVEDMRTLIS